MLLHHEGLEQNELEDMVGFCTDIRPDEMRSRGKAYQGVEGGPFPAQLSYCRQCKGW